MAYTKKPGISFLVFKVGDAQFRATFNRGTLQYIRKRSGPMHRWVKMADCEQPLVWAKYLKDDHERNDRHV